MSIEININQTESVFREESNVESAYLFGSYSKGSETVNSDLDIGVFFNKKPDIMQLGSLRADLQTKLHFENIDLVVLNNASPILRFEAVTGQKIFSRDRSKEAELISLTAREYEDEMGMFNKAFQ